MIMRGAGILTMTRSFNKQAPEGAQGGIMDSTEFAEIIAQIIGDDEYLKKLFIETFKKKDIE